MTSKSNILIELEGIAPLLATKKIGLPLEAPEGYFELFADNLLDKIHFEHTSFSVPDGYFEGFAAQMMQKVRSNEVTEELKEIAPFLNEVSKTMPFYVPEGYFENLTLNVEREKVIEPAKVVSLFGSSLMKWAVAAAIILSIGITWMYFSTPTVEPTFIASATLTEHEMDSLLNQMEAGNLNVLLEKEGNANEFTSLLLAAQEGVEKSVQSLSTEELNRYLENYSVPGSGT